MKTINLEEILNNNISQSLKSEGYHFGDVNKSWIIKAMKEACRQTLELAAENAETKEYISQLFASTRIIVNKQSILDTIKQVN